MPGENKRLILFGKFGVSDPVIQTSIGTQVKHYGDMVNDGTLEIRIYRPK